MPIAVLKNGEIRPLEPLPADWQEGRRLRIESADDDDATVEEIDRDFALLASLCADSDPEDEVRLGRALDEARNQAKEQVRRHSANHTAAVSHFLASAVNASTCCGQS